jgi:tetratricopeptide (TPR) repeat protein
MASPDAARHVHEALFYHFEGYQTRDGELLFARIERTVREAVRRAEEAGIPDAEYRIKQFILEIIDVLGQGRGALQERRAEGRLNRRKGAEGHRLRRALRRGAVLRVPRAVFRGRRFVGGLRRGACGGRPLQEAVEYVQKAAKALYEAAREVFERVKVTVQRLVELFVEAVARALAWIDEHKAYLFLMAAVAAGAVALSAALDIWGLIELDKLAYAASLTPFVPAGVKEYSREEVFNILKNDPDPYERFKKIAREANRGKVKLAEPWESLRKLIMPRSSEKERLMKGRTYRELDERKKKALFYAAFALEEAFSKYRTALKKLEEAFNVYGKDVEEREKVVQRVVVGEEPFKQDMYVTDLEQIKQLAEEEGKAFEEALRTLRKGLIKYAVRYDLGNLLIVEKSKARGLAEAETGALQIQRRELRHEGLRRSNRI